MKKRINNLKLKEILEKVNQFEIKEISKKKVYRVSTYYLIKSLIFLAVISAAIILSVLNMKKINFLVIFLLVFLSVYVVYSIYYLFSYTMIIDENKLIIKKQVIELDKITSINLAYSSVASSKLEEALKIVVDNKKEYVLRLNIKNNIEFIKQISKISKVNVGIE
ncbi:hypothetical protein [Oceanivirga miroungae]|uniref:DUF304 domain-containing protein n=1 Tax=Oceanivirga miroungae TaxID=1130046 RepID=A0A6I8M8W7_9FUSO|nr:hypothetical protein [Oceanivirga miroungae]VWL85255.1 hypothetical protein OMES3154_00538 [Oceanivirga miroungae]